MAGRRRLVRRGEVEVQPSSIVNIVVIGCGRAKEFVELGRVHDGGVGGEHGGRGGRRKVRVGKETKVELAPSLSPSPQSNDGGARGGSIGAVIRTWIFLLSLINSLVV